MTTRPPAHRACRSLTKAWNRRPPLGRHLCRPAYTPSLDRLLFQRFTGVKLEDGNQWHRFILSLRFLPQYRVSYDDGTEAVEIAED